MTLEGGKKQCRTGKKKRGRGSRGAIEYKRGKGKGVRIINRIFWLKQKLLTKFL